MKEIIIAGALVTTYKADGSVKLLLKIQNYLENTKHIRERSVKLLIQINLQLQLLTNYTNTNVIIYGCRKIKDIDNTLVDLLR